MQQIKQRIAALRRQMKRAGVTAYFIPSVDPHQSEYVPGCWQRRQWISGFSGSAGDVLVTADSALLWTDGRYHLQAEAELRGSTIELMRGGKPKVPKVDEWIARNLGDGDVLGVDPRVLSRPLARRFRKATERAGAKLKLIERNLVDAIWDDQPTIPQEPIEAHPRRFAGKTVAAKLKMVRKSMRTEQADALVLTTLDAIAWLFNVRGQDVPYNPVVIAYAIVEQDRARLFCSPAKVTASVRRALRATTEIADYDAFGDALRELGQRGACVWVDADKVSVWVMRKLKPARLIERASPIHRIKARKNDTEQQGARAAHLRDGAAMARFLCWLEHSVAGGGITEIGASDKLHELRAEGALFRGNSFSPISGYGAHGAIVHYSASPHSDARLRTRGLYLIDSGGQYRDGTTDITRTVLLGARASRAQREQFTRVLKGHIAVARCRFPAGTTGRQLDVLARVQLWHAGLDYAHGTGHGVGSYLNVHEGPQSLSPWRANDAALEEGNIVSDEPGYYRAGAYGMRIENLLLVVRDEEFSDDGRSGGKPNGAPTFLRFETLTLCPIDRRLIEATLLDADERRWINSYHKRVRRELSPLLGPTERRWLQQATRAV